MEEIRIKARAFEMIESLTTERDLCRRELNILNNFITAIGQKLGVKDSNSDKILDQLEKLLAD